jgi:hypothetical protein
VLFLALENALGPWQNRYTGFFHGRTRLLFQAHAPEHRGRRPDEAQVGGFAHLGEIGVLGKEAVAGMDGVGVGDFGRADHRGDIQIAARALGGADADGLVGKSRVETVASASE